MSESLFEMPPEPAPEPEEKKKKKKRAARSRKRATSRAKAPKSKSETAEPTPEAVEPEATEAAPEVAEAAPEVAEAASEAVEPEVAEPTSEVAEAASEAVEPEPVVAEAASEAVEPESVVAEPVSEVAEAASEAAEAASEAGEPKPEPGEPESEVAEAAPEPGEPESEAAEPEPKAAEPEPKAAEPEPKAAEAASEAAEAASEAAEAASEVAEAAPEAVEPEPEAVVTESETAEPTSEAAPSGAKPAARSSEPTVEPSEPTTETAAAAPEASGKAATPSPTPSRPAPTTSEPYRVLALRYRPQTFADLVGQETIARTLQNAIRQGRIWNAFLFAGPRGVGKTTTARIVAKALNCSATPGPNPEPCGTCDSCVEIAGGYSRDVPEIDGASNNSVENVRELREEARYVPARDRYRIYLIDEVHMLSVGAFNALLKTLEEPPSHVRFLFATTEMHRVPETILSRCQVFEFRTASHRETFGRLRHVADDQGVAISDEALSQVARAGQGSLRDSLSALDQVLAASSADREIVGRDVAGILGLPDRALGTRTAKAILDHDLKEVFVVVEELIAGGRDPKHFVQMLLHCFRDLLVSRVAPDRAELLEWREEAALSAEDAARFSVEELLRSMDVLTGVEQALRWSPDPRFHLEMALLKLVEMPRLAAYESLVGGLESGGAGSGSGPAAPAPASGGSSGSSRAGGERRAKPSETATSSTTLEIPEVLKPVVVDYIDRFGGSVTYSGPFRPTKSSAAGA